MEFVLRLTPVKGGSLSPDVILRNCAVGPTSTYTVSHMKTQDSQLWSRRLNVLCL